MKTFTNEDLRIYLLNRIYYKKYRDLAEFLKTELGKDSKFDLFEYLYQNGTDVILTAKNSEELNNKIEKYINHKFKLMHYNIFKRLKSHIEDRRFVYWVLQTTSFLFNWSLFYM